jgi:hypothetical protein
MIILILVCSTDLKTDGRISTCPSQHKHCSKCSPSGCLLCHFLSIRSLPNFNFDNPPSNIQRIIDVFDTWEKKFEEAQQLNSNNFVLSFDRQNSSTMDVDTYEGPTESMFLFIFFENYFKKFLSHVSLFY